MAKKSWSFELDGKNHEVELDHQYLSSKRQIWIDGKELDLDSDEAKPVLDFGSDHQFKIGNHFCTVVIRTNGLTFNYDLVVDGVSKKTGKQFMGKSATKRDYSLWWGKIESREMAEKILKNVFWGMLAVTGISALFLSVIGNFQGWTDFALFGLVGLWLWKRRSLIAAGILVLLNGAGLMMTFTNKLGFTQWGGNNLILAAIAFLLAIRGWQAVSWFRKNK